MTSVEPKRRAFSLRSLLTLVAVVAVLLGIWFGYRRTMLAQLQWLSIDSTEAEQLFPTSLVTENSDGKFTFSYYSRRCSLPLTCLKIELEHFADTDFTSELNDEAIILTTSDRAAADAYLTTLQTADQLVPGTFAIRGRVIDKRGNPVRFAHVDLMGSYVFINRFRTREDGTFTMPLFDGGTGAPAGMGYYLRIRTIDDRQRWNTATFALNNSEPERVAIIVVPGSVASD